MNTHAWLGRSAAEASWHTRRAFVQTAAAWLASGGYAAAMTQQRGNIVEASGDFLVNGHKLPPGQSIQAGDTVETGPGSKLVFVVGDSAFQARSNSRFAFEAGDSPHIVRSLRLLSGGIVSVWGAGPPRQIAMPNLIAGIRGTGTYAEVFAEQGQRSYLCNCYGMVEMRNGQQQVLTQSDYHQAFWGEASPRNGLLLTPAPAINHDDAELEALAALLGLRTRWQILGRKGVKDGRGYMD